MEEERNYFGSYKTVLMNWTWRGMDYWYVVAPYNKEEQVYLHLTTEDGKNDDPFIDFDSATALSAYLQELSTQARFRRFSRDFRATEGFVLPYMEIVFSGETYFKMSMRYASDLKL